VVKRPKGITVMACVFLFMGFSALNALVTYLPQLAQKHRLLAFLVANLLIAFVPAVALLKMKSWSRWVAIAVAAFSLVFIPREVQTAHGVADMIRAALRTLFNVWVIWYLAQPHIKAAFRKPTTQLA